MLFPYQHILKQHAHIEKNFLDFCHEYSANKSAYYTITCPDCGYTLQLSERDVDDLIK